MASQTYQQDEEVSLNPLGQFVALLAQYGQNASRNLTETVTTMEMHSWIRLIIIIGGYMLLRPYALKFITKGAIKKYEEDSLREEAQAQITPNELRGAKLQLEKQEDEDRAEASATATDWGQKARLRQREILKTMMEAEEKRRQEEEDDKDIEEFLTQ